MMEFLVLKYKHCIHNNTFALIIVASNNSHRDIINTDDNVSMSLCAWPHEGSVELVQTLVFVSVVNNSNYE